ncbi:MAG TPA: alpha/beta hydrolase domain-containing protein [Burkholderiales bacterium]|nr:alpha/beta hydrolase domain-containing protein [Burkholderiales bacterium]
MRTRAKNIFIALILSLTFAASTQARITRIDIEKVESPTFGGTSFGNTGQYEKFTGKAYGELDPAHELNRGIALLDKAPRNAAGRVEYSVDILLLKPVDMSRGNRTLIYDTVNRGNLRAIEVFNIDGVPGNNPSSAKDAGDGFLFKQGYSIISSGWPGDALPGNNRLTARFPVAKEADGKSITQTLTVDFTFRKPAYSVNVGYDGGDTRPYPAVTERASEAQLYRRAGASAPREPVPKSEWSFGKCADGKSATASDVDVCYPAGFTTNYIYDLVYVARDPVVMGIGFASTRDLMLFLRHERSDANPIMRGSPVNADAPLRWAVGFGRSQSGRYIKDFVYQGFNLDEEKRIVFEGLMPLISGSRLMSINAPFGMPSRSPGNYGGDQFPHTYATIEDPISKKRDGWLERCTAQKACPKVMHMDSGTEAWLGRNALVITDASGKKDQPIPDNVRLYYFASTQHNPSAKADYGICKNLSNVNPRIENIRALLVAMQAWVSENKTPPPSRFPRVSDGTLVAPAPAEKFGFPAIPGVSYNGKYPALTMKDYKVQPPRSIPGTDYPALAPKVDADGNDIGGIRSVSLEVPLATYMGWNHQRAGYLENELCYLQGSTIPFAKTAAERGADPRPSLQERYGNKANYVSKVEAAAAKAVKDGLLLPDDAARVVGNARKVDLGF